MNNTRHTSAKSILLLCIVYVGFISLGLPDAALDVAWPFMSVDFGAPISYAGWITALLTACSAPSATADKNLPI